MGASFITFADLGKRRNMKTVDILPLLSEFSARGEVNQVICRLAKDTDTKTRAGLPLIAHYILKGIEKLFPVFPGRNFEEHLLDIRAARMLRAAPVTLMHPAIFPRTIARAKKLGSKTAGIAVIVHPATSETLLREESRLLGIPFEKSPVDSRFTQSTAAIAGSFDYIIAVSDFVKQSYVSAGFPAENIFIAQNDIDFSRFVPGEKTDDIFRVLYVANTNTLKGLHYLLEAWKIADLQNSELVIVGGYSTPMPKSLRVQYEETIANNSTIRSIGHADTLSYFQSSSVFAFPSLTEGNPRVVMEALSCGLPVITTEHASSIVRDGESGFIVPIRDAAAIADRLRTLAQDPELRVRMSAAARQSVLEKKPFGSQVYDAYTEILKRD
jgi:glycosyltransferase involved in cell wall biosynthesis